MAQVCTVFAQVTRLNLTVCFGFGIDAWQDNLFVIYWICAVHERHFSLRFIGVWSWKMLEGLVILKWILLLIYYHSYSWYGHNSKSSTSGIGGETGHDFIRISPDFVNKRIFGHLTLLTWKPLSQEGISTDINTEKKRLTKMGSELISLYRFIWS